MGILKRTLAENVVYPPHPPRKASALYDQTHKELVYTLDTPCAVCGVKHSTLNDPEQNIWGSKALETHHDIIEWAGATEIDWDKLAADHPTLKSLASLALAYQAHLSASGEFNGTLDPTIVTQFVDSTEQMLVLCDIHHRAALYGIHMITGPVFGLQRYEAPGYRFIK